MMKGLFVSFLTVVLGVFLASCGSSLPSYKVLGDDPKSVKTTEDGGITGDGAVQFTESLSSPSASFSVTASFKDDGVMTFYLYAESVDGTSFSIDSVEVKLIRDGDQLEVYVDFPGVDNEVPWGYDGVFKGEKGSETVTVVFDVHNFSGETNESYVYSWSPKVSKYTKEAASGDNGNSGDGLAGDGVVWGVSLTEDVVLKGVSVGSPNVPRGTSTNHEKLKK